VYKVVGNSKPMQIPQMLSQLTMEEGVVLCKYLYKLMAQPVQFQSAILLTWHEKLVEQFGNGSIVRCLTDRNTV
jgi:actin related protein 2/3 complex subunit 5